MQVLELAGNAIKDNKKNMIIPRLILLAVRNNDELRNLFMGVTITHGGVLSNIHIQLVLFSKKSAENLLIRAESDMVVCLWKG
jgi:hypothetical protein